MDIQDRMAPLTALFATHHNAENAVYMKQYMKGQYAYFGIKSPLRKELEKKFRNSLGKLSEADLLAVSHWCWQAEEREYQYFIMELLRRNSKTIPRERLDLYERMIVEKSWWDTIDFIAVNLVGPYFKQYPDQIPTVTQGWMASQNIWLQRTCILFQLKYKNNVDLVLLDGFIQQLKDSREFFIRKAIGWMLREYSKTDADFVIQYLKDNKLSGLSEREALKWLKNKGLLTKN